MKWIDSHCHLDFKNFQKDLPDVLERTENELELAVNVASDRRSNAKTLELAKKYPFIYGVLGLHPHDSADLDKELLDFLEENISHPKIVAVGEIGLDFFKNHAPRQTQEETFRRLALFGKEHDKPLVIHSRDAIPESLKILQETGISRAVFHCFTGNWSQAKQILDQGYFLSFSGVITFGKNPELEEVVQKVPSDCFFVETDAPFLTPHPYRGKRNEPVFVKWVGERAAILRGQSAAKTAEVTAGNVKRFFGIGE